MLFARSGIYKQPLLRGRGFVPFKVPSPLKSEVFVGLTTIFDKPELNCLDIVYTCPFVVKFSNTGVYAYGITIGYEPYFGNFYAYPMVLLFADKKHSANDIFAVALDGEQTVMFYRNFKLLYKYTLPSIYYYVFDSTYPAYYFYFDISY
jgi:hypothetical protein